MRHLMKKKKSQKGQSILEYVAVASVVASAFFLMSTYVNRSVQATQQMIQNEWRNY